jgi:hypothetical protein
MGTSLDKSGVLRFATVVAGCLDQRSPIRRPTAPGGHAQSEQSPEGDADAAFEFAEPLHAGVLRTSSGKQARNRLWPGLQGDKVLERWGNYLPERSPARSMANPFEKGLVFRVAAAKPSLMVACAP